MKQALRDTPIQRKLMTLTLLTSGTVLLVTCAAFFAYEFLTFRQSMVSQLSTLGEIVATNSTAALAYDNRADAQEILAALKAERHVVAAGLYDKNGRLFSKYPSTLADADFPAVPAADSYQIESSHLIGFQPVVQGTRRLGTLYLKSDMEALYERFRLYGVIVALVIVVSFLLAYVLSKALQQQISRPILALAETARAVSQRRDYSVRATQLGKDEVGFLTEAFNQMLAQIETQNRALSESETRTRAILNAALSAVVVIDANGAVTDWNPRAEKMFDWKQSEVTGRNLAEIIIPPRYREAHRRGLEHFRATGEGPVLNHVIEISGLRRDGTEFPVELAISPMRSGDTVAFCGFITDITERKRLEEGRVRLAAIVESSDDAIISQTLEGVITSWNPGAEKLFGYPASEAIGQSIAMLIPPDRIQEEPDIRARISRGESVDHLETTRLRKDGTPVEVSVTLSPMRDGQGKIVGASMIARDTTERRRTEARLQSQLARLDLLSQITRAIGERQDLGSIFQEAICSVEDNLPVDFGCVCLYEPASQTLTVRSVGKKSAPLAIELALTEHASFTIDENGLSRCVRGELVYEPDLTHVAFSFPQRLARCGLMALVAAPLRVESNIFGVFVAARCAADSFSSADNEFLRQLSEHVALAANQAQVYTALQQAYDDLRQTQQAVMQQERLRALGQMASGIAHDINNAISPVSIYAESMLEKEPNLSARGRDNLTTIVHAMDDVAQTVSRMREFYRQREPQLALAPVEVNRLIEQVADLTRARWGDMPLQRGVVVELRKELAPGLPVISGVESEIREALLNLIFNAVDAMPDGGTLTLRTRLVAGHAANGKTELPPQVVIEVIDTGVGMDEATRRRCLEPFFTTKGERGTGLGLAMVYGIVQRHSAEIEIESAPGRGTTMRLLFSLPVADVEVPVAIPAAAKPSSRLRLLVVDDDPVLLKSLREILEGDGHEIVAVGGGQLGVDAFRDALDKANPFAAVITDLGMPHMDGRRVASAVKAAAPATPVFMLTGWGNRMVAEGEIPPHVDRVLNKPPKLRDLRDALASVPATTI